jgi:hypothetical protein
MAAAMADTDGITRHFALDAGNGRNWSGLRWNANERPASDKCGNCIF